MKLRAKSPLDAGARLVARPEVVAKRLDHVIGRDADVHGAAFDHFQHSIEYAYDRAIGTVLPLVEAAQAVEMPEQLVGSVYNVNDHGRYAMAIRALKRVALPMLSLHAWQGDP